MNWHVNGRASMPCDAPTSVDLNTQTPPRNSPSLLPLMHQHRLKLAMARLLLNLSQYSGSRNPQANVIDLNFLRLGKSANIKTLPHYGNRGNFEGGHPALYIWIRQQTMSALIFVNKNMEVKYRRVKVGFVFEFNRLISNYCAYDDCNIMVPTFSVKWKPRTDSTSIVSL